MGGRGKVKKSRSRRVHDNKQNTYCIEKKTKEEEEKDKRVAGERLLLLLRLLLLSFSVNLSSVRALKHQCNLIHNEYFNSEQ